MNISPTVAISTQDHILAALLFDYIVPLYSRDSVPKEVNFNTISSIQMPDMSMDKVHSLAPQITKRYDKDLRAGRLTNIINQIKHDESIAKLISEGKDEKTAIKSRYFMYEVDNYFTQHIHKILQDNNVRSVPVFHSTFSYQQFLSAGTSDAVEITLNNAKIIDTSKLEWKHVLEIRRDKHFSKQLRSFRLFLNNNYQGRDVDFIKDDLQMKLDEYEEACRRHGIQLILSTISQTLDSKSLLGSLAITTACLLTGNSTVASLGIIGGATIEIGKVVVNVMQKKLEYVEVIDNAELSYLFKLEKRIKK